MSDYAFWVVHIFGCVGLFFLGWGVNGIRMGLLKMDKAAQHLDEAIRTVNRMMNP